MKEDTKRELMNYKEYGTPLGSFLQAVLQNNLIDAMFRADEDNARDLKEILRFISDELPWSAWGGPERIKNWTNRGGLKGIEKEEVA
jgi:hypothetical protein